MMTIDYYKQRISDLEWELTILNNKYKKLLVAYDELRVIDTRPLDEILADTNNTPSSNNSPFDMLLFQYQQYRQSANASPKTDYSMQALDILKNIKQGFN